VSFVAEFGRQPKVLPEMANRMIPRTWWGSMIPDLEPWLALLEGWRMHPMVEVRTWAQEQIEHLNAMITVESKRDQERSVGL
jgi:hypothetical protein